MKINGKQFRTIWFDSENKRKINIIDQRHLPHEFIIEPLETLEQACTAISEMHVRGAGLIGATAGFGMYLASLQAPEDNFSDYMTNAGKQLSNTRPTARNLNWAVERQLKEISENLDIEIIFKASFDKANRTSIDSYR